MTLAPECLGIKWDGAATAIVLFALPLAVVITAVTLVLYRRAVERAMRASPSERVPAGQVSAEATSPIQPLQIVIDDERMQAAPRMRASASAMRGLTLAYALAGLAQSLVVTSLWFALNDIDFLPFRAFVIWLPFAWPIVLGVMLTATTTRRQRGALIGGYFIILLMTDAAADAFGLRFKPGFGELLVLWAVVMGPPTLVIVLLGNRAWRSVGLLALLLGLLLSGGYLLGFQVLGCLTLSTRSSALLEAFDYLLWGLVLACLALGVLAIAFLARRYQARRSSDQMLLLDGWWLLVTLLQVLSQLVASGFQAFSILLAYVAYKIVLRATLTRTVARRSMRASESLLLLRVFGHTGRTRSLTDQVGQFWRYNGPINMIGGTDLATALIEPDELMQFWTGKLRRNFIASASDLEARLRLLDDSPDPDGRYRVNEFFCQANAWQAAVHDLARRSKVVLMDLRSFGRNNRGCEFELGLLLHEVPLGRVVLLIDGSTRREELESLVHSLWSRLPEASLNRSLPNPVLQLLQASNESRTLERVVSRIFARAAGN